MPGADLQAAVHERGLQQDVLPQVGATPAPPGQSRIHELAAAARTLFGSGAGRHALWLLHAHAPRCVASIPYRRCIGLYRYVLDFRPGHPNYRLRLDFCRGVCPCCLRICVT